MSNRPLVVGVDDMTEQPRQLRWNNEDGFRTERIFHGPADVIEAQFNDLVNNTTGSDEVVATLSNSGKSELRVVIVDDSGSTTGGNTEENNSIWEVLGNDVYKDLRQHPKYSTISTADLLEIENALADGVEYSGSGNADEYYKLRLRGTEQYIVSEVAIRKTVRVGTRSGVKAAYSNMNRVIALGSINPPSILLGALNSLPLAGGGSGSWEWLKKVPQVRHISRRQFEISYDYWGAEKWSKVLYGGTLEP